MRCDQSELIQLVCLQRLAGHSDFIGSGIARSEPCVKADQRGAAARASRSLMARPNPVSGIGATAIG